MLAQRPPTGREACAAVIVPSAFIEKDALHLLEGFVEHSRDCADETFANTIGRHM
jgi:hypothetical protein